LINLSAATFLFLNFIIAFLLTWAAAVTMIVIDHALEFFYRLFDHRILIIIVSNLKANDTSNHYTH